MNKNLGFTLAEVLITLGIIGVVAALTAPALVKNSGQSKIGPSLAKFVNTWETACEQMLEEENASKLSSVVPYDTDYAKNLPAKLSKYMIMSPTDKTIKFYNADGTEYKYSYSSNNYILKDGTILHIDGDSSYSAYTAKGAYKGNVGEIVIGFKGIDNKNIIARDAFCFKIDDSGILVPYGGNTLKWLNSGGYSYLECDPNHNDNDDQYHAWACTGAIADNGYKADY